MKIELGGGSKPYGNGFQNIDISEHSDLKHNLCDIPWPLEDESVEAIYSSHCLEHLDIHPQIVFDEICRICKIGAGFLLKVPAPHSDMALTFTHKHVYSPIQAINAERYFPKESWKKPKRLRLVNITYGPSILLPIIKNDLPFLSGVTDEMIMKWFPRVCHECVFDYVVVENEYYDKSN